jgi:hypothetical protein
MAERRTGKEFRKPLNFINDDGFVFYRIKKSQWMIQDSSVGGVFQVEVNGFFTQIRNYFFGQCSLSCLLGPNMPTIGNCP